MKTLFALLLLAGKFGALAGDLPAFDSDAATDRWLRETSAYYRMMAAAVDGRTGYTFRGERTLEGGLVVWEAGQPVIELGDSLAGARRVGILIFELTNCYQSPQHQEVDQGAAAGRIKDAREFGLLHEMVELDGLRHHRLVLEELDRALHGVPPEMFRWISSNPKLDKLADYQLPFAYDYLKAQNASGHTQGYYEWFPRQARTDGKAR